MSASVRSLQEQFPPLFLKQGTFPCRFLIFKGIELVKKTLYMQLNSIHKNLPSSWSAIVFNHNSREAYVYRR